MVGGGVLEFDKDTTKSKVGDYFKKIKDTVEGAKSSLDTMVESMKAENNPNASKTADAVTVLNAKLDKIIQGAKKASEAIGDDTGLIADFNSNGVGAAGEGKSVESLTEGIKKL